MRQKPGAEPSQFKWTKERSEASLKREKRQKEREAKKQFMFTFPSTAGSENELQHDNEQIFQQSHACPQVVDSMEVGEEVLLQISSNPAADADFLAAMLWMLKRCFCRRAVVTLSKAQIVWQQVNHPMKWSLLECRQTSQLSHFCLLKHLSSKTICFIIIQDLNPPPKKKKKFVAVFQSLGPAVNYLSYYRTASVEKLTPMNQFLLMLAKLRQDVDFLPLARMCGVSMFTVENLFITWVNFCSRQWGEIHTWVKGELVRYYAPSDFAEKFPKTSAIIDGTEIPIERPSNPFSQRATFSTYKKTPSSAW